ncbi:MAG: hypothetical protein M1819_005043 [Sarea resinae]|nr:MAG: hypothetical protein M1819_005043 [Sarea resinae]
MNNDSANISKSRLSQLGMRHADARPPLSVPSAALQAVIINLEFAQIQLLAKGDNLLSAYTTLASQIYRTDPCQHVADWMDLDMLCASHISPLQLMGDIELDADEMYSSLDGAEILEDELDFTNQREDPFFQQEFDDASMSQYLLRSPEDGLGSNQRAVVVVGEEPEITGELLSRGVVSLTDLAMRSIICKKPKRSAAGIKSKRTDASPRLSEIFPAIWSPGYLPVSEPTDG